MPPEDEFRRVAEDVRELARALRSELRTAKWEAKEAARQARREMRDYYRSAARGDHSGPPPWNWRPPTTTEQWVSSVGTPLDAPPPPPPPADAPRTPPVDDPARWGPPQGPPAGGWNGSPPSGGPPWAGPPWGGNYERARARAAQREAERQARRERHRQRHHHHGSDTMVATSGSAPEPLRKTDARPPLRHRKDSSTLLSLLLVTVGLAWLFSETGIYTVSLEAVLAVCLAIVGVAMVITARTDWSLSRKHWPMWLGIGLLVVLLASTDGSAIGSGLASLHFGPIDTAPTSWASATYSNLAGPLDVDLSHLPAGPDAKTIRVQNTFGPIRVTLPAAPKGYQIDVDARTTFGPVTVPGQATSAGTFSHQTYATQGRGPVLHVDVRDSFGPVIVQTAVPSS